MGSCTPHNESILHEPSLSNSNLFSWPRLKSYETMCPMSLNPLLVRLHLLAILTVIVVYPACQLQPGTPHFSTDTVRPEYGENCKTSVCLYSADVLPSIGSETSHGIGNTLNTIVLDVYPFWTTWGGASGGTSVPALIQESRACQTEKPKRPPLGPHRCTLVQLLAEGVLTAPNNAIVLKDIANLLYMPITKRLHKAFDVCSRLCPVPILFLHSPVVLDVANLFPLLSHTHARAYEGR